MLVQEAVERAGLSWWCLLINPFGKKSGALNICVFPLWLTELMLYHRLDYLISSPQQYFCVNVL